MFRSRNPGLFYHHSVVQQLKKIYDELLRPELVSDELTPEPSTTKAVEKAGKKDKVSRLVCLAAG